MCIVLVYPLGASCLWGLQAPKALILRGLPSCSKALYLGDLSISGRVPSCSLVVHPGKPLWCWLRLWFEMGIKSAGGENARVSCRGLGWAPAVKHEVASSTKVINLVNLENAEYYVLLSVISLSGCCGRGWFCNMLFANLCLWEQNSLQ